MHQGTILSGNSYRISKRKVVDFSSNVKLLMCARKNPLGVHVYQFHCLFYLVCQNFVASPHSSKFVLGALGIQNVYYDLCWFSLSSELINTETKFIFCVSLLCLLFLFYL